MKKPVTKPRRLHKPIEIVALLSKGGPLTVRELAERTGRDPNDVRKTMRILEEFELVRFDGWAARDPSAGIYGQLPAKWAWV